MANFEKKSVAIVGLGYVGLPLALRSAEKGYRVIGLDIDEKKINELRLGEAKVEMEFTTDSAKVKTVETVIICVPTPIHENRLPDYGPIESACVSIAPYLSSGQLIILESTVNPGACEEVVIPILEKFTGMVAGKDFGVAHCPERINPGDPTWNVGNIARVVGAIDAESLARAVSFYESIVDAPIKAMGSIAEAEAVKVVENSFRNLNIAFVNELAVSFQKLGIDVVSVINGAATKPFGFMPHYPGCGLGGHCIPVDPYYLIDYAYRKTGFEHKLLKLACETNEYMPSYTVGLFKEAMKELDKELSGAEVAVLGLAFKGNIGDDRESPAYEIIKQLSDLGVKVRSFDPRVLEKSSVKTLEIALKGVVGAILVTAHDEFKQIPAKVFFENGARVVVDGRNIYKKEDFDEAQILYRGIGR